jgi:hypothetical protein
MSANEPRVPRPGKLKNGNSAGNPNAAPRCGAKTRRGISCRQPAIKGRVRCRLHGGWSTGPTSEAGKKRSSRNALKHGRFTAKAIAERRAEQAEFEAVKVSLQEILRNVEILY